MLTIENHKLKSDQPGRMIYRTTKKSSGQVRSLEYIVLHYTAGLSFASDVAVLSSGPREASCQVVVGWHGEIAQINTLRDRLWHAGASSWNGRTGLNSWSFGIEVTSPGVVEFVRDEPDGSKTYSAFSRSFSTREHTIIRKPHRNGGPSQNWLQFNHTQLDTIREIVEAAVQTYPSIKDVVCHDQISPGRKQDCSENLPDGFLDELNRMIQR